MSITAPYSQSARETINKAQGARQMQQSRSRYENATRRDKSARRRGLLGVVITRAAASGTCRRVECSGSSARTAAPPRRFIYAARTRAQPSGLLASPIGRKPRPLPIMALAHGPPSRPSPHPQPSPTPRPPANGSGEERARADPPPGLTHLHAVHPPSSSFLPAWHLHIFLARLSVCFFPLLCSALLCSALLCSALSFLFGFYKAHASFLNARS